MLEKPVYLGGHVRGRNALVLETLRDTHSTSTDGEKGPLAIVLGKYAGMRPFEVWCCELINQPREQFNIDSPFSSLCRALLWLVYAPRCAWFIVL